MKTIITLLILGLSFFLPFAHSNEKHGEDKKEKNEKEEKEILLPADLVYAYQQIDKEYQKSVEPIFRQSCFDCHSNQTVYPWYYNLPGAKQLIDHDIKEGLEHIDFSDGFPFKGHAESPEDDIDELAEVVRENTMPPKRYWLLHPNTRLSTNEKIEILIWIRESREKLEEAREK